jgi:hypothetical protein
MVKVGKDKVIPLLNKVPHHEDALCLTKHHIIQNYEYSDMLA